MAKIHQVRSVWTVLTLHSEHSCIVKHRLHVWRREESDTGHMLNVGADPDPDAAIPDGGRGN